MRRGRCFWSQQTDARRTAAAPCAVIAMCAGDWTGEGVAGCGCSPAVAATELPARGAGRTVRLPRGWHRANCPAGCQEGRDCALAGGEVLLRR